MRQKMRFTNCYLLQFCHNEGTAESDGAIITATPVCIAVVKYFTHAKKLHRNMTMGLQVI